MRSRSSRRLILLVSALVLTLLAAACTVGGDVSETGGEQGSPVSEKPQANEGDTATDGASLVADDGAESPTTNDKGGGEGLVPVIFQVSGNGRDIIFTADMTVAVVDVAVAEQEAIAVVNGLGGFLFGQHSEGSPDSLSVLTFKILPESFEDALAALGEIGEVRAKNVSASDVTDRLVDLESQITTAEASVARLRALLSEATDIKQIVSLEKELLQRETTLEGLRGQLRTLEDQVALATIVISITEAAANPAIDVMVTGYSGHDSGELCPGSEELSFEAASEATLCYTLTNVGDTSLAGFELRDPVLDIEIDDLVVVVGDIEEILEPGATLVLAAEVTVERALRLQTSVSADPVDDLGAPLSGTTATYTASAFVDSVDPGGLPSFNDGLEKSWEWLVSLGELMLLAIGAAIPFLWIPLVAWLLLHLWSRRQGRTTGSET